jgi:hypothetical protein
VAEEELARRTRRARRIFGWVDRPGDVKSRADPWADPFPPGAWTRVENDDDDDDEDDWSLRQDDNGGLISNEKARMAASKRQRGHQPIDPVPKKTSVPSVSSV